MSISGIGPRGAMNPSQMASKMVTNFDTNKDGSIDKTEFVAGMKTRGVSQTDAEKLFATIDTKGSGKITQSDIEAAIKKTGGKGAPPAAMPSQHGGRPGGAGGVSQSSSSKTYDPRDTNKDGKVSIEEVIAYALAQAANATNQTATPVSTVTTNAIDVTA